MTLTEIARQISEHLDSFWRNGKLRLFHPGCHRGGRYVRVTYITYQGATSMDRAEAEGYLAWLDAGNVGRHFEWQRERGA